MTSMEKQPIATRQDLPVGLRIRSWLANLSMNLYVPEIMKGMLKTFEWMVRPKATLQYPEVKRVPRKGYRGEHRLKRDDQGRMKCVACFMCQTACPAECIEITAGPSPWPDRDKVPVQFRIDMLKCIYCGMCEEACPCDAIELTETYTQISTSREEKIYDIKRLLSN
jgi:NADH-quinone oxidoreductase subunit I